ncbi:MAG: ribosomal-protein-alanine N-acetyltransferase [SAR202 cluster bacterium Io17-Chloro-G7]|nr:MAG: ribosomal-protein-alanine N-acetyltransferase [SAR202 cluster bacterium Io17-Chloro-G7]
MQIVLRRLRSEDINQVIEIEREAFSPLWVTTPFKRELNNRYACYLVASNNLEEQTPISDELPGVEQDAPTWRRIGSKIQGLLGKQPQANSEPTDIAGYVSVWYQGEEAHITEIAVRESMRGNGIGELLLIGSLRAAVEYGSKVMTLEVRVSNFIAQNLYEKYAFKSVGIRKGYYSDNREDAAIMTTSPINTEEYQRMFEELQEAYRIRRGEIKSFD